MFTPGPMELVIILVIVLVVFGPSKIPQIGRDLGKGLRSFKSIAEGKEEPAEGSSPSEDTAKKDKQ